MSNPTVGSDTPAGFDPAAGSAAPPNIPTATTPVRDSRDTHRSPLDDVRVERPKSHPIAYAALALATLALLLSIAALSRHDDHGYRRVQVAGKDCVIGRQDKTDLLYCAAGNTVTP